jgi:hypothetical protein
MKNDKPTDMSRSSHSFSGLSHGFFVFDFSKKNQIDLIGFFEPTKPV